MSLFYTEAVCATKALDYASAQTFKTKATTLALHGNSDPAEVLEELHIPPKLKSRLLICPRFIMVGNRRPETDGQVGRFCMLGLEEHTGWGAYELSGMKTWRPENYSELQCLLSSEVWLWIRNELTSQFAGLNIANSFFLMMLPTQTPKHKQYVLTINIMSVWLGFGS